MRSQIRARETISARQASIRLIKLWWILCCHHPRQARNDFDALTIAESLSAPQHTSIHTLLRSHHQDIFGVAAFATCDTATQATLGGYSHQRGAGTELARVTEHPDSDHISALEIYQRIVAAALS